MYVGTDQRVILSNEHMHMHELLLNQRAQSGDRTMCTLLLSVDSFHVNLFSVQCTLCTK